VKERATYGRIPRSGVADDAIEMVKNMILNGDLTAHQRLPPERVLAEMLGVSRPTLRESIRALTSLHILESKHGEGTFVTSLDPTILAQPIDFVLQMTAQNLDHLIEVRAILEPATAMSAAAQMTPDILARLRSIVDTHGQSLDDASLCIDLDVEFHQLLALSAGNPILTSLLAAIDALGRAGREQTTRKSRKAREVGNADLLAIVEALESGDPVSVGAAMASHIRNIDQSAAGG
jgi:GntR family transcriptional regulator, transcriptional repressor for pyruvate dehydrogenase complex